jgi:hypothetical protein
LRLVNAKVVEAKPLNEQVDRFFNTLVGTSNTTPAPLIPVLRAHRLKLLRDQTRSENRTSVVFVSSVQAGGTSRVRENIFLNALPFSGMRIKFTGGAIVNYQLISEDGSILLADSIYNLTDYRSLGGGSSNAEVRDQNQR